MNASPCFAFLISFPTTEPLPPLFISLDLPQALFYTGVVAELNDKT